MHSPGLSFAQSATLFICYFAGSIEDFVRNKITTFIWINDLLFKIQYTLNTQNNISSFYEENYLYNDQLFWDRFV